MENQFTRILPSLLFAGALGAIGCLADTEELDVEEAEELEAEAEELDPQADALDDLVDESEEARSGGGCGGGCCGGGGGCCPNDHEPPIITCKDLVLWPPNHKYHEIDVHDCIKTVDECDPNWSVKITKVTSDEPDQGQGDGNTTNDIKCGDRDTVELRAERSGNQDGRVYWIWFLAKDSKHNWAEYKCKVIVPHDQGQGNWAGDSGVKNSKTCNDAWPW